MAPVRKTYCAKGHNMSVTGRDDRSRCRVCRGPRLCKRGHDTHITGRDSNSGCSQCRRMRETGLLDPECRVRLPLAPLEEYMAAHGITFLSFGGSQARQLFRWRHAGIPLYAADELACRLGLHPTQIWGMAFVDVGEAS